MENKYDIKSTVIHWVGGKKRLLPLILDNIPKKYNNYFEPFIGGAIVFTNMKIYNKSYIGDFNKDLVNLYRKIKNDYIVLVNYLLKYEKSYNNSCNKKKHFLNYRKKFNNLLNTYNTERAALYIYINKTCFNSIMQFNKEGLNTSAFGNHNIISIYNKENFDYFKKKLKKTTIYHGDYRNLLEKSKKGDFIYLDPPYVPDDIKKCTIKYNKDGWVLEDFDNLVKTIENLDKKGCKIMLSNSNSKYIRKHFPKNKYRIIKTPIQRVLARGKENRGIQYELIIMNY